MEDDTRHEYDDSQIAKDSTASSQNENVVDAGDPASTQTYTVDEAINSMGFGPFQILISTFCGLLWLADAMELMILSVLSPAVKCQWGLSNFEEALISSIVFLGFFIGGPFWGVICDKVGRKNGLFIINMTILAFGVLSALRVSSGDTRLPGYPWLLICRFGVGFGSAGTDQVVTYYAEFLPLKFRGICIVLVAVWWAIGTMFGAGLAVAVMREGGLGWHWYLGLATIPLALVTFLFPLIPESARFYLVKGKIDKAQKVIKRVAWYNFKEVPPGRIVPHEEKEESKTITQVDTVVYSQGTVTIQSSHSDHELSVDKDEDNPSIEQKTTDGINSENEAEAPLLEPEDISDVHGVGMRGTSTLSKIQSMNWSLLYSNGMWKTTLILLNLWIGGTWLYYGSVLLTTTLLQYEPHCGKFNSNLTNTSNDSTICGENQLDNTDYLKILWTSAAELPGILITVVIIELFGRKITLATEFIGSMIGFLLLFICASEILITFFLFVIRAFATGAFQAIYVYTPEVYPTKARGMALGVCTSAARIGAITTPYVAQVLLHVNDYATLALYAGSSLVLAVLAMLLPIETKGRALHD